LSNCFPGWFTFRRGRNLCRPLFVYSL
jgi:hypothetical protein